MIRIGQRLQEVRSERHLTLDQISKAIKIKPSFLLAIEEGAYDKLPSSAYAQGFVGNYAKYLGIPRKEAMALFRREFDEDKVYKVLPEGFTSRNELPVFRIRLQQTVLVGIFALFVLVGYLLFQYRFAFINPPLSLKNPLEKSIVSSNIVNVSGTTDPNATVYVQNEAIFLNANGSFYKKVNVFPGNTTIEIRAVNRFGKETRIERHITVKP